MQAAAVADLRWGLDFRGGPKSGIWDSKTQQVTGSKVLDQF